MLRKLVPVVLCAALVSCGKSEPGSAPAAGGGTTGAGGGGGTAADTAPGAATPEEAYRKAAEAGARSDWKALFAMVLADDQDLLLFGLTFGAAFASMGAEDPATVEKEAKDLFAKHKVPEKQDGDSVDMNDETKMRAMLKEKLKDVPDKGALAGDLIMFMKKHSKKGSGFSMFEGTLKDVKTDGEKATGTLSKPDGDSTDIRFAKKDGRWYLAIGK
ncbi:MAG: hypothetical protein HYY18_23500 [Planctomycetes bacterium]|nr:hypothetical protein [Planctomycetota bacterium]